MSEYTSAFQGAGLALLSHEIVQQVVAPDGRALLARTKVRADSVLARLDKAAFDKGIDSLSRAVQQGEIAAPVLENLDLLDLSSPRGKKHGR